VPLALQFERRLTEALSAKERGELSKLVDQLMRVAQGL
jgi:hypothetical protein